MASSSAEPMPQTIEAYKELAQRDLELIMDMKGEISLLKSKVNDLKGKNNYLGATMLKYSLELKKVYKAIEGIKPPN